MLKSFAIRILLLALFFSIISCSKTDENPSPEKVLEIEALIKEGIIHVRQLDFEQGYNSLNLALKEAKSSGAKKQEIQAIINLCLLYDAFNDNEKAIHYSLKALDLTQEYQIDELYNSVYNNIGISYTRNKNFEEAERYFRMALAISVAQNSSERISINLINIAEIKSDLNQLDSSIYYNELVLGLDEIEELKQIHSIVYNNMGEIFQKRGDYTKAVRNFSKALSIAEEDSILNDIALLELNIGISLYNLAQYDSANYYLNNSLNILLKSKNAELISKCYYHLYKNEIGQNTSVSKNKYIEECLAWKDSSMFANKNKLVTDIKLEYEFQKKLKEIEYLEEKASTQRLIIYSVILLAIIFTLFIISIWNSRNKNLKQRNLILKKEKELSLLEKEKNELKRLKLEEEIVNQKRLTEIKEKQTKLELEHKNREVTSRAIHLMNKNEVLGSIQSLIENLDHESHAPNSILKEVKGIVKNNLNQDKTWDDIKLHFEEVHEGFVDKLTKKHPDLSPTDFRLCAYLLLDLSPKEIANISNISPESVRKRKQRLRGKLKINSSDSIEEYLKSL